MPKFIVTPNYTLTMTSYYIEAANIKEAHLIAEELPPHLQCFLDELEIHKEITEIEHEFTYVFEASKESKD